MPDVQVSQHDTCMKVFPAQMQKQTKVTSFGDITDILLT